MSKKKKADEPKDDGPKGPSCRYFHESQYVWIGNEKQGYYSIDGLHPCRFIDNLYGTIAGVSIESAKELTYRTKFYDACWYWLTPDIARARLDLLIDEMAILIWHRAIADNRTASVSDRDSNTAADKAMESFYGKIPAAPTLFDKPKGRR